MAKELSAATFELLETKGLPVELLIVEEQLFTKVCTKAISVILRRLKPSLKKLPNKAII